jgi:hypothetical protein
VQAEPVGQRDEGYDGNERHEPPDRRAGFAGCVARCVARSLASSLVRSAGGCAPIIGRRAHNGAHGQILRHFNDADGAARCIHEVLGGRSQLSDI